jgi:excisionase family DNA binding protein
VSRKSPHHYIRPVETCPISVRLAPSRGARRAPCLFPRNFPPEPPPCSTVSCRITRNPAQKEWNVRSNAPGRRSTSPCSPYLGGAPTENAKEETSMASPTLLKVREVADHFRVTNPTVLDWVRKGRLKAVRTASGQYRITDESFKKLTRPVPEKQAK